MAEFGTFEYGTDVYGVPSDLSVTSVDIITPTLIRVTFNREVLVNSQYYNISNYSIRLFNTSITDANVRKILMPFQQNSDQVALTSAISTVVTDPLTIGSRYTFMVSNVTDRSGLAIVPSFTHRYSRRTKTASAIRSLPSNYDLRSESTTFNILAAISRSDDQIGGTEEEILL